MTFFEDEPIRFKMRQNLLPQIQDKTLLFNFGAINEVMEGLKTIYDSFPFKRTLRQQRIISFNNWVRYTKAITIVPFDSFEEEIMKGRINIVKSFHQLQGSKDVIQSVDKRQEINNT